LKKEEKRKNCRGRTADEEPHHNDSENPILQLGHNTI